MALWDTTIILIRNKYNKVLLCDTKITLIREKMLLWDCHKYASKQIENVNGDNLFSK